MSSVGCQVIASVAMAALIFGNPICPGCESLLAETAEIERFDEWTHGSSSPDVFLETTAFMARKVEMQFDVTRCNLPPPTSSRKILNLLCTLLI